MGVLGLSIRGMCGVYGIYHLMGCVGVGRISCAHPPGGAGETRGL